MSTTLRRAIRATLAAIVLLIVGSAALVASAIAAPLTTTSTPDVVYLFVVIVPASPGRLPYEELWRTTDKAACDDQVADWAAKKVPAACLPHRQRKLKEYGSSSSTDD